MTSVLAGHIIPTPTQPVGSGRPQRGLNPPPPHQESHALLTELPPPPPPPIDHAHEGQNNSQRIRLTTVRGQRGSEREREREREIISMHLI